MRVGPFLIGTVKTSPRATNRARSPFGESEKHSMFFSAEIRLGRDASPSFGTLMASAWSFRPATSKTRSSPFSS